jgi:hypothetical protein
MSEDTMHLLLEINRLKAEILVKDTEIEALKAQLEKSVADGIHKNLMSLYDKKASEK